MIGKIDGWMDGWGMGRWIDGRMDGWTDEWIDEGWMGRWMDGTREGNACVHWGSKRTIMILTISRGRECTSHTKALAHPRAR